MIRVYREQTIRSIGLFFDIRQAIYGKDRETAYCALTSWVNHLLEWGRMRQFGRCDIHRVPVESNDQMSRLGSR